MTSRPQTIQERIACWQQAYWAVLEELARPVRSASGQPSRHREYTPAQTDTAARVAATLAIGATARSRNTGGE